MNPMSNATNYHVAVDSFLARSAALGLRDSVEDAKILTDTAGRIQYMNLGAEQLLGVRFEQTRGRPLNTRGLPFTEFFNLIDECSHESLDGMIAECLARDATITLGNRVALINKKGEQVSIGGSLSPMRVQGFGTVGVIMTFRDATPTRHLMGRVFDSI
ncbi:MAG TPA: PAS domain-containing protein [Gammaproteobacteria bacterium]|nr:PAS domain-containing protein [Gammaproteobacteria bacterium]